MSPKFLDQNGFTFSIFSNEEDRMHVHVFKDDNEIMKLKFGWNRL